MSQSKLQSFLEAWANTVVGFVVAIITQYFLMHFYGYKVSLSDDIQMALIFTALSVVRSYWLRRVFNKFGVRKIK